MAIDLISRNSDSFGMVRDIMAKVGATELQDRKFGLLADYFQKAHESRDKGEPLAWVNFATIAELFWAMDLTPVFIDALIGPLGSFDKEKIAEYVDLAETIIPDHVCATNKGFLGAILKGDIPVPDLLVNAGHPCDSNIGTYPVIAKQFGFSYFCIDAPYFRDDRGVRHLVSELKNLVAFLEEVTGKTLEYEKLRQVMEYSNQAHEYVLKINRLKMAVPAPCSAMDSTSDYLLAMCLSGTPEFADYCEKRYEALKAKVQRGEGAVPEEKIRIAWIFGAPSHDASLFPWLESEYQAASIMLPGNVMVEHVQNLSSTESILEGLAGTMNSLPMARECGGPWENYIDAVIGFCDEFKADAAIFMNNFGCQHNWPITKLVKDKIYDELGIHTLVLGTDFFDPRTVVADEIKTKVGEFMTVITAN